MADLNIQLRNPAKPYAVLTGLDSMQGIQAARILAGHQVPVVAIAGDAKHPACRTNVCEHVLISTSPEEVLTTLEMLGPRMSQKAVLFPCTDGQVSTASSHRDRLAAWYHVVLPDDSTVRMLMDKISFATFAQERGLAVPETRVLRGRSDAEEASRQLSFPCALKPPYRTAAWIRHTSLKAFKAESPEQLLDLYDEYHGFVEALIAQEWIEGDETELYSCNCYYDREGQPLVTFVARKLRQWPPQTGQSSLGVECRNDVVLQESLRLFNSVRYQGLGYVEIKRDVVSGRYFIVEPNIGRPTGRSAIAEAGGVDLLYTMYCDALGLPPPPNRTQSYGAVKWIHLRRDTQAALYAWWHGDLSLGEWWRSVKGRKGYALFSVRDLAPFFHDLLQLLGKLISAKERRRKGL